MAADKLAATFHDADNEVDLVGALRASIERARADRLSPATEAKQRYEDGDEEYSDAVEHAEAGEDLILPPDLTPEQDLRAAVTERLTDAVHFGGCTDDPCDCLVGRLRWAIDAEQVSEAPSETEAAIQMVARHIRAHRLDALYIGDLWEDYPEIGEDNWRAIVDAVSKPAAEQMPDPEAYIAAYDHLTKLAEAWTAENGGAA